MADRLAIQFLGYNFTNSDTDLNEIPACFLTDDELHPSSNIPKLKLFVVTIYAVLSLTIIFNLRVIYMVIRVLVNRPSLNRPDGNRHAFIYVLALSVVDSVVLAHLPLVATDIMLSQWVFGDAMCKLYWLIEQVNRVLSTFILTALSADRYLAVCLPIKLAHMRTSLAATGVVGVCVLVASGLLVPTVIFSQVVEWNVSNHTINKCMFAMDATTLGQFLIYFFMCVYCIPLICMVYFYANILYTLWQKHASPNLSNGFIENRNGVLVCTSRGYRRRQTAVHVTKKALILVSFYFACWTPYWIVQFYIHFVLAENEMRADDSVIIAIYAVHVLVYVNSAVNPFLYALLNKELQRQHSMAHRSRTRRTTMGTNDPPHQDQLRNCKNGHTNTQEIRPDGCPTDVLRNQSKIFDSALDLGEHCLKIDLLTSVQE